MKLPLGAVSLITLLVATASLARESDEAIAPGGTIGVASTQDFRTVFLISPRTGAVAKVHAPVMMAGVDIAPDGSRLAISGAQGIWVFSRSGAHARRVPVAPSTTTQSFGEVGWAPDGRRLVYVDGGGLFVATISRGKKRKLVRGDDLYEPDWSPRGGLIAFVRDTPYPRDGPIHTIRTDGRGLRSIVPGIQPDISPDGSKLAFVLLNIVYVMSMTGGEPKLIVPKAEHPEWSPDGRYLAFTRNVRCAHAGCMGRVFVVRSTGGKPRAIGPEIFDIGPLSWSK